MFMYYRKNSSTSMARGLTLSAVFMAFIALVLVHETCSATANAKVNDHCAPSSCGNIHNISFPFRLKNDPEKCGDSRYELSCENNHTLLSLFERRYYVKEINYNNYTIRIVDSGIQKDNYSFTPWTGNATLSKWGRSLSVLFLHFPYSCAVSIGFVLFIFSYYSALKSLKIGETKQRNCEERPLAVSIVCFIMHLLYNSFSRKSERLWMINNKDLDFGCLIFYNNSCVRILIRWVNSPFLNRLCTCFICKT